MISQNPIGRVALVGAGPGDPGLLTVRGARLLERAEVVVYDHLANPKLLSYCPHAETIYAGKKAGAHSMTQERINELLIQKAREGRRVVRLKGGDPFVFGRGGEECEALASAGIEFEVVPGITAAIAAPAYAGIPATHRDFNSSFTLITGHEREEEHRDAARGASDIDWASIAKLPCVAFYMGVKSLPRICAKLIEHGMPGTTPAASIQWGTTPIQRTVVGTIATLPEKIVEAGLASPAITIIGRVVTMRETINWFESRPLFGRTIIVTRTRRQMSELSERLETLGANVIEAPTIELYPPEDWSAVDEALVSGAAFDWLVFTSANGARFTRDRLRAIGQDVRLFGNAKVAAVGEATALAVREELGLRVDLSPPRFLAEALADELRSRNEIVGRRFLLLRADLARPILPRRLEADGAARVCDVAVYETRPVRALAPAAREALREGRVDWITFASGGTARHFVSLLDEETRAAMGEAHLASIGPITTRALKRLGFTPAAEPERSDIPSLVEAIRLKTI